MRAPPADAASVLAARDGGASAVPTDVSMQDAAPDVQRPDAAPSGCALLTCPPSAGVPWSCVDGMEAACLPDLRGLSYRATRLGLSAPFGDHPDVLAAFQALFGDDFALVMHLKSAVEADASSPEQMWGYVAQGGKVAAGNVWHAAEGATVAKQLRFDAIPALLRRPPLDGALIAYWGRPSDALGLGNTGLGWRADLFPPGGTAEDRCFYDVPALPAYQLALLPDGDSSRLEWRLGFCLAASVASHLPAPADTGAPNLGRLLLSVASPDCATNLGGAPDGFSIVLSYTLLPVSMADPPAAYLDGAVAPLCP